MAISKMPPGVKKGKKHVPTATPTKAKKPKGLTKANPNIVTRAAIKVERKLTRKKRYGGKGQRTEEEMQ